MRNPFRRTPKDAEVRSVDTVPWSVGGSTTTLAASAESALRLAPVYAAARLLSDSVASLPLQQYRRDGERRIRIPTGQLFTEPAVSGTPYDWLHECMTSLVLHGNSYGLILTRDGFGFPTTIEWLDPAQVTIQDDPGRVPLRGRFYYVGGEIPREDLLHIKAFSMPGRTAGVSPLRQFAELISGGVSAMQYGNDWFRNGGVPPGTFKNTEKTVTQVESDAIRARLVSAIRARQPLVHGSDWEFKAISIPPEEAQFIETMKLNATQIAAIYGIPPERIGGERGGRSLTYATQEQEEISFLTTTIRPWLVRLENAFNRLLPERQYVRFNADAMIRTDLKTRHEVYQIDRTIGLKSIDEIRALEDLEPLPAGQGSDPAPLEAVVAEAKTPETAPEPNDPPALPSRPRAVS